MPNFPNNTEIVSTTDILPVALDYVKLQARLSPDDTTLDLLIYSYIHTAVEQGQAWLGKTFVRTNYKAEWNSFCYKLSIQDAPDQAVLEIKYIDTNDVEQTIDPDDYLVVRSSSYIFIHFYKLFEVKPRTTAVIKVFYLAGYDILSEDVVLTQFDSTVFGTTSGPHDLKVNDLVEITGADQVDYNGSHVVNGVFNATDFSYKIDTEPVSPATGDTKMINRKVPQKIQLAIASMVVSMLNNAGDCSDICGDIPCQAQKLLSTYKSMHTQTWC